MLKYFFASLLLTSSLFGFQIKGPHQFSIGPEFYHSCRTKKGGSEQNGWMYGGRARYERLRLCGWYWGIDGMFGCGRLDGKLGSGKKIKSEMTDAQIEGRLGYTFYLPTLRCLALTGYGGYGYFYGLNKFVHPSPIHCRFHNSFQYAALGFLSSFYIRPCLYAGLDFKAKYMINGKAKVTNDPKYDKVNLDIGTEWQYEVDLPINYTTCWGNRIIDASLVPFYRHRHYGGKPNYPFDFIDTKFQIYGVRLLVNLCL